MVYLLNKNEIGFPNPRDGEDDGFFAVGGDLSADWLLLAYSHGIFPWYAYRAEDVNKSLIDPETGKPYIKWWCPMQRFVIFPNEIHISHSMRQELKKVDTGEISVTCNQAFDQVIEYCRYVSCGKERDIKKGAWLGDDMVSAYRHLHDLGYCLSIEVWDKERNLIGGLYGISLGYGFFGESMFSLKPNASKVALIMLCKDIQKVGGINLIDCQLETNHLRRMGGRYISYDEYIKLIRGNQ